MRLTTLARKLKITPSKLIDFLFEHDFQVDKGVNTKLNEETVLFIKSHFELEEEIESIPEQQEEKEIEADPKEKIENLKESTETNNEKPATSDIAIPIDSEPKQEEKHDESPLATAELKAGTIEDLEEGKAEEIDLIKVKKVKLEGIKVVGKIELPEKQKKEAPKKAGPEVETPVKPKKEQGSKRANHPRKKYQKGRKNRKPLSYEEKLKIEERNKKRQLREKLKKEKERKKAHYEQTVKAKVTSKSQKKKKKRQSDQHIKKQQEITQYKNPIKRFWAWLNGKYDEY